MYDFQGITDFLLDKILGSDWSDYHLYVAMFIVLVFVIILSRRKRK